MSHKLCVFAMHTLCLGCSIEVSSISGAITPHLVPTKMVRSTTDRCAVVHQVLFLLTEHLLDCPPMPHDTK